VPRIGGTLQSSGKDFLGRLIGVEIQPNAKTASLEIGKAYDVPPLLRVIRRLLAVHDGEKTYLTLEDEFNFLDGSTEIEEALMTWLEVEPKDDGAVIHGTQYDLALTLEEPTPIGYFRLERLEAESRANRKSGILKRITYTVPPTHDKTVLVCFRMEIR
jgi:hypothetical protein